jgi:hypothetical protein
LKKGEVSITTDHSTNIFPLLVGFRGVDTAVIASGVRVCDSTTAARELMNAIGCLRCVARGGSVCISSTIASELMNRVGCLKVVLVSSWSFRHERRKGKEET